MREEQRKRERRSEHRYARAGHVTWRKAGTGTMFHGWLSDISPSSVSFIAPAAQEPSCGEDLEVLNMGRSGQVYRVTRISAYDDRLSLIAGRREHPAAGGQPTSAARRPKP